MLFCKSLGKLTDDEYDDIKNHPSIGAKILGPAKIFEPLIPMVLHHHERYDGKGYPGALIADQIPLMARIVCVADSFDAMTSDRAYRPRFTVATALEEISKCKGSQFDPDIVDAFLIAIKNNKEQIEKDIGLVF